jgi:cob(I)alamin adenosyltransferase
MKLSTKTGDMGTTGLIGGTRVAKNHARVACYGEVDELNAHIGFVASAVTDGALPDACSLDALRQVQSDLFVLGAQLASEHETDAGIALTAAQVERLDGQLDAVSADLPELRNFVLPGGCELAARLHLTRTVCRRAERSVVALAQMETVDNLAVVYLNRLGDLLFALALAANQRAGVADVPWVAPK